MDLTLGLFQIGVLGALAAITGLLWCNSRQSQHIHIVMKCKDDHDLDFYVEEDSEEEWQEETDEDAEEVNKPDEQE